MDENNESTATDSPPSETEPKKKPSKKKGSDDSSITALILKKVVPRILKGFENAVRNSVLGPQDPPFKAGGHPLKSPSFWDSVFACATLLMLSAILPAVTSGKILQCFAFFCQGVVVCAILASLVAILYGSWCKCFSFKVDREHVLGAFVHLCLPWIVVGILAVKIPWGSYVWIVTLCCFGIPNFIRGLDKLYPKNIRKIAITSWTFFIFTIPATFLFIGLVVYAQDGKVANPTTSKSVSGSAQHVGNRVQKSTRNG